MRSPALFMLFGILSVHAISSSPTNIVQPADTEGEKPLPLTRRTSFTATDANIQTAVGTWCGGDSTTYGDISTWDTSEVTSMNGLFYSHCSTKSTFNGDITKWDVSKTTDFSDMFRDAGDFNQDISNWDVSKSTSFSRMFTYADEFNQNLARWDVSEATDFYAMFRRAKLTFDLSSWDVSKSTTFAYIFYQCANYNQVLCWDATGATTTSMFGPTGSLNPSAPKCSCLAGTYYDGTTCTQCASGETSYNYAGSCITCASGFSNEDQTACATPPPTSQPTPTPQPTEVSQRLGNYPWHVAIPVALWPVASLALYEYFLKGDTTEDNENLASP